MLHLLSKYQGLLIEILVLIKITVYYVNLKIIKKSFVKSDEFSSLELLMMLSVQYICTVTCKIITLGEITGEIICDLSEITLL